MLQQVILETANPMTLNIEAADPDEIIIIKSISGLSPADVTLFTGDFAKNGGYYQGRRVGKRNPVINFKMNPDYANDIEVSDIREMLYRQFLEPQANSDGVQMRFVDDRKPDRYLIGYVENMPTDIFSKTTDMQVSMLCVDPFFKSVDEVSDTNPSGWVSVPISYDGSADTGIELTIEVQTTTETVVVANNDQLMTLVRYSDFVDGDIITINTTVGERFIRLNGVDIMSALSAESDWIELKSPGNDLNVYATTPSDGGAFVTAYSYRASWWGV